VCRKKHNKLEFLMPWWDLQLGVSVNQFLSIFASKNSDFRYAGRHMPASDKFRPSVWTIGLPHCTDGSAGMRRNRAFAFLFADGSSEELSSLQVVEAHTFPQHFSEMTRKVGLAPAAIVSTKGHDNSVLKSLDANRPLRSNYPLIGNFHFFLN
jgi:hypothetical protein